MIDGIKLLVKLYDFDKWKEKTGISFSVATDTDTGAMKGYEQKTNPGAITYIHSGEFETYVFKVKVTETRKRSVLAKRTFNLLIDGSLHKNHFGDRNFERFYFDDLQFEIGKLCRHLFLSPEQFIIQNLEIGVNIKTPFLVKKYINGSMLLHSTKQFENYKEDKTGYILGRVATHTQHSVKCYDKGVQNDLEYPLMRFEDRCIKMQYLAKYGIETLKDLQEFSKVKKLENLLLKVWDDVLIYEPDIDHSRLNVTAFQRELIKDGQNRDFWIRLHESSKKKFNKQRTKFRQLMAANSRVNTYSLIRSMIKDEWAELIKTGTSLPSVKIQPTFQNIRRDIFTIRVNGKNVPPKYYNNYIYY